ncbi:hypothetical protein [Jiangella alkaliphila]|uniref:Uncharacterized protein n=1 Tax=Jiangella alkaliphila TaxID=419479 RepID=A0A1H2LDZ2_9ACTN|nr:hypothetical protein [Jiangella alkaliphila]SDU79223.1 hypothetical protein SAMN04488563_5952 [Jiangella alkaliphila]
MPERHVLAPLRRWLIQPGSPPKVIAILLLILMASMVTLLTVRNEAAHDNGGTTIMESQHRPATSGDATGSNPAPRTL